MRKRFLKTTVMIALILALIAAFSIIAYADADYYKKGDHGKEIAEIQKALRVLGLFNEEITGYFGTITEEAVKKFQKLHQLEPDGVVGPGTLKALLGKSSLSGKTTSRATIERTKVNITYVIQQGDTIWDIADAFNVTRESILKYNNLTENSILHLGQKIIIPNVVKIVVKVPPPQTDTPKAEPPKAEPVAQPAKDTSPQPTAPPVPADSNSSAEAIGDLPDNIYIVKEGDTLASIAEDYGVSIKDLAEMNGLAEDAVLQADQELKIPETARSATDVSDSTASSSQTPQLKGEYLSWFDEVQYIFEKDEVAVVTDIKTGKSFKIKRLYGRYHADVEPLTKEDTAVMKSIYGSWSWDRRAIIVTVDGRNIAASMNGMPHGGQQIDNNDFQGHFCVHFKGSKTHKANRMDPSHQAAVKLAAGI